jgi:hypothetical protein
VLRYVDYLIFTYDVAMAAYVQFRKAEANPETAKGVEEITNGISIEQCAQ